MLVDSKRRNVLLVLSCFIIYLCTFFLKYSYNATVISIESRFNVSDSEAGVVSSLFFITYGLGQFVNGLLVRKYKLKYVIPGAVFVSCVLNILVFIAPSDMFLLVKIYWAINGAVLSIMWPSVIMFFVTNVYDKCKDKDIFIIGMTYAIGTALTYALASLLTKLSKPNLIFLISTIIGLLSIASWFLLHNKVVKEEKGEWITDEHEKTDVKINFVLYVALCIVIVIGATFIREGICVWSPLILYKEFNVSESFSVLLTVVLPISEFTGVVLGSTFKKRVVSHLLLCVYFLIAGSIIIGIGYATGFKALWITFGSMFLCSICVSAPIHIIVNLVPVAWSKERNTGLFAGIFNGCSFIGAAVATYSLSIIADKSSWITVLKIIAFTYFSLLLICALFFLIRKLIRISRKEETKN